MVRFATAVESFNTGLFSGIAFVLTKDDPFVCVDFDHVSEWPEEAGRLIASFDTYNEKSPSGDGTHIWLMATKPDAMACKSQSFHNSNVELYEHSRFITMTGNTRNPVDVANCQDALEREFVPLMKPEPKNVATPSPVGPISADIADQMVKSLAAKPNFGEIHDRLSECGKHDTVTLLSNGSNGDHSADDLAVCNDLAYVTGGDAELMDQIIRRSAMMRPKWDKVHRPSDGATYGQMTIERAIKDTPVFYEAMETDPSFIETEECEPDELPELDIDLIDLLPDNPLNKYAANLALLSKMPRNTTYLTVLGVFSLTVSRYRACSYENGTGKFPLIMNVCIEQPSGTAKSRILKACQAPIFRINKEQRTELAAKKTLLLNQLDGLTGDAKKDIQKELDDIQRQHERMFTYLTDATPEALDRYLDNTNGFFALASAENAVIDSMLGAYSSKKDAVNRDLLLKGFVAEWHHSIRNTREGYKGEVVGGVVALGQTGIIQKILDSSGASGFFQRVIAWGEPDKLGQRDHLARPMADKEAEAVFHERMAFYHKHAVNDFDLMEAFVATSAAWHKIDSLRNKYEPMIANCGRYDNETLRGIVSKMDMFILKIASLLHCADHNLNLIIEDKYIDVGISMFEAYLKHMDRLILSDNLHALPVRQQMILDLLNDRGKLTGKQICDAVYRRKQFINKGKYNRVLVQKEIKSLCDSGLIKFSSKDGKRDIKSLIFFK